MNCEFAVDVSRELLKTLDQKIDVFEKADGSSLTSIDPLAEKVCLKRLSGLFEDCSTVAEETGFSPRAFQNSKHVMSIDGIDGTSSFIRHVNGEVNQHWMLGMTAIYRREGESLIPVFGLTVQPAADRTWFFDGTNSWLIEDISGEPRVSRLLVEEAGDPKGWLDGYALAGKVAYEIDDRFVKGYGPSGFNFSEAIRSCVGGDANFTSFHYMMWDMGLWPVAYGAGFRLSFFDDVPQTVELSADWFRNGFKLIPIKRPVLLAPPALLPKLAGAIRKKPEPQVR